MSKSNKAIAKQEPSGFAIIDQKDARETMLAAFDQLGVTESLLQRVKVPTGGMAAFMVEELDGQNVVPHLDVIMVAIKGRQKAWWAKMPEEGGTGSPPSCTSTDGLRGFGNNTLKDDAAAGEHLCAECPWSKFGSARNGGAGKDCGDYSVLFFFREGSRIPAVLNVPGTSLKGLQSYILKLIDNGKRFEGVVTRIAVKAATSKSGITYSQLDLSFVKDLSEEAAKAMTEMGKEFMGRIRSYDAFNDNPGGDE
jgi:hypothetical protein